MPQVIFYREFQYNEIFAYFPRIKWDYNGNMTSYTHMGQHSGCSKEYVTDRTKCELCENESEYADLLQELKNQGYKDLKVKNCVKLSN